LTAGIAGRGPPGCADGILANRDQHPKHRTLLRHRLDRPTDRRAPAFAPGLYDRQQILWPVKRRICFDASVIGAGAVAEQRVQRRLAAILAADVAGYSRLMGLDEIGTLAALKALRGEIVDPAIAEHNGRTVKTTGDGMLVEFASVVDAVNCAMGLQGKMADSDGSAAQGIRFRIGINVGDIIFDDGDIFGDGVNIAARIEGECPPGGVCVSDDAYRQIRGKVGFVFDDLGERTLKNIPHPVRIHFVRSASAERQPEPPPKAIVKEPTSDPEAIGGLYRGKPTLAVLPFQNMSEYPDQEHFADGLVEDITTALSRISWLSVIARNSSFTYKRGPVDIRKVGRELGARYVMEGSVRKSGDRLRVTCQLIEAQTGSHIWAERYEGKVDNPFDIQDRVTAEIAGTVEGPLQQAEVRLAQSRPTKVQKRTP
jgi:adenylate cyclase